MQSLSWITFCASSKVLKTMLHMFASSTNATTPFPITCKLTLFGEGVVVKTLSIDDVRLNQAKGVYIDAVFPELSGDYAGFIGMKVEFMIRQSAANLAGSNMVLELLSYAYSTKFYPSVYKDKDTLYRSFPIIKDNISNTSLVLVNYSSRDYSFDLLNIDNEVAMSGLKLDKYSVKEYELKIDEKNLKTEKNVFNSCWANGTLDVLKFKEQIPSGVNPYVISRDITSKKIISCFAL